jgi:hypothetical protein
MKYLIILINLSTLSFSASAQDFIIKLNPKEDTTIKNRNFYFDSVTDDREEGAGKRLVGRFGKNDKTAAVLEKDLEPFFMEYLSKAYPQHPGDKALSLRVNEIHCSSAGGMLSEAKVKLDIDVVNSVTNDVIYNIALEKTKQPLMGGKTFGVLIEEIISYGVGMIKEKMQ